MFFSLPINSSIVLLFPSIFFCVTLSDGPFSTCYSPTSALVVPQVQELLLLVAWSGIADHLCDFPSYLPAVWRERKAPKKNCNAAHHRNRARVLRLLYFQNWTSYMRTNWAICSMDVMAKHLSLYDGTWRCQSTRAFGIKWLNMNPTMSGVWSLEPLSTLFLLLRKVEGGGFSLHTILGLPGNKARVPQA